MKITLDKLAPYLPYGLQLKHPSNEINKSGITQMFISNIIDVMTYMDDNGEYFFKPILRPLSDLTREEYWKLSGKEENKSFGFWYFKDVKGFGIYQEGYTSTSVRFESELSYTNLRVYVYDFLLENHFDVFGLIDQGLAIDINTLEK